MDLPLPDADYSMAIIAPTSPRKQKRNKKMKVKDLIKALSELPQNAEVFFLSGDNGVYQINAVKTAKATSNEVKEITGKDFVVLT